MHMGFPSGVTLINIALDRGPPSSNSVNTQCFCGKSRKSGVVGGSECRCRRCDDDSGDCLNNRQSVSKIGGLYWKSA